MNFGQAKAFRMQRWRLTLDEKDFRMQNPEAHRETLHEMAAALFNEGLIDQLERFDMNEMADAAYWHSVEELQNSPVHYRGASTYNVVQVTNGKLLGTISRSIFNFATNEPRGASFPYDGKVYSNATGVELKLSLSRKTGKIIGLSLNMSDGQLYQLIETERVIGGISRRPIDDPDFYRAITDAAQLAKENRDLSAYEKVRSWIESATFTRCSECLDRFGEREDCHVCAGNGFVTKLSSAGPR